MCTSLDKEYGIDCCEHCPLDGHECGAIFEMPEDANFEEIEQIVTSWAKEHPEPPRTTWLEYFQKHGLLSNDYENRCYESQVIALDVLLKKPIPHYLEEKQNEK